MNSIKIQMESELRERDEYAQKIKEIEEENKRQLEQMKKDMEIAREIEKRKIIEEEKEKFNLRKTVEQDLHSKTNGRSKPRVPRFELREQVPQPMI